MPEPKAANQKAQYCTDDFVACSGAYDRPPITLKTKYLPSKKAHNLND